MKLETLVYVLDFTKLKERLSDLYDVDALVTAHRDSGDRFIINVYLTKIFADEDISVLIRSNVDVDDNDLLKFSAKETRLTEDSTKIDMIKSEIEKYLIESIKLYNAEIENGNNELNAKIEEFHSLIKEFNFESNPYQLAIINDLIKLHVQKMHPHQKDRYFTIAKISEYSYDELIFIVKTQIRAINFYDELLCREDLFDVRFKISRNRRSTLDVILKDSSDRHDEVRVRMIDSDMVEVEYSIYSVVVNSEYVKISDKNSQIFYRVSSNEDDENLDFQIETATKNRCYLRDLYQTIRDVKFRLQDRIIRIEPVED